MELIWIKKIKKDNEEWISIDLDSIKSFSCKKSTSYTDDNRPDIDENNNIVKHTSLYINNEFVVKDLEQILYEALKKYITQPDRGAKYSLQDSVSKYNKGQS